MCFSFVVGVKGFECRAFESCRPPGRPPGASMQHNSPPKMQPCLSTPIHRSASPVSLAGRGLGICSVVLGSLSILACCVFYFAMPLAGLGILLGLLSIAMIPDRPWLGITGLGLSIIGFVLPMVAIVLFVIADQPVEEEWNRDNRPVVAPLAPEEVCMTGPSLWSATTSTPTHLTVPCHHPQWFQVEELLVG